MRFWKPRRAGGQFFLNDTGFDFPERRSEPLRAQFRLQGSGYEEVWSPIGRFAETPLHGSWMIGSLGRGLPRSI
jgi:hypothetical protein